VSREIRSGTITIPKLREYTHLTLLTAISAFGDSIQRLLITKNKAFEKIRLEEQLLYHGHDDVIRTSAKTFMTEVLFVDWLQNLFLRRNEELRSKWNSQDPIVLRIDGHSTHIAPRVVAYARLQKILIIRLVPQSSEISRPLDLTVFSSRSCTNGSRKPRE
jgi:hypothetical protein